MLRTEICASYCQPHCHLSRNGGRGTHVAGLYEVAGHEQVLAVGRDLDVVRADDGLRLLGVVEALDVVEVRDVERRHVVAKREREVGQPAVGRDVAVDGHRVPRLLAEVVQQLGHALLAVGTAPERVDDPNLAEMDGAVLLGPLAEYVRTYIR